MARSPTDTARLEGAVAAKRLHRVLDLQQRVTEKGGQVDVFEAIAELGIPLMLKPLKSALGLCLPKPLRGILVTTRRGLHIQRFTAAHELGHAELDHRGSIDYKILERGPYVPSFGRDIQEVEADAFAAEFILPRWLYRHHIQAQGWSVDSLVNPEIVYQLSLRMGASYAATCWGLLSHQVLNRAAVAALRKVRVVQIKTKLGEKFKPADAWADIWKVTTRDAGRKIVGNPEDLLRLELDEDSSGGYQWKKDDLIQAGYEVLSDNSAFSRNPLLYGEPAKRTLLTRPAAPPAPPPTNLTIRESQPWDDAGSGEHSFAVQLELRGPEVAGLSRADKRRRGVTQ